MAHPKRKISKTRRNKRRTHQKLEAPLLVRCGLTGEFHPPHEAYTKKDKLYYRGKLVTDLK
ncbi:MAG: 50S ribosomal protein L32 [Bacteroidota bacterium]